MSVLRFWAFIIREAFRVEAPPPPPPPATEDETFEPWRWVRSGGEA